METGLQLMTRIMTLGMMRIVRTRVFLAMAGGLKAVLIAGLMAIKIALAE